MRLEVFMEIGLMVSVLESLNDAVKTNIRTSIFQLRLQGRCESASLASIPARIAPILIRYQHRFRFCYDI